MSQWGPYVPVATRRAQAFKKMEKLRKSGIDIRPVQIEGRKIARTFWGKAWCDHLESFSDYENRLPRGRTYVRNGSVCHLAITAGEVNAMVSGSKLYTIKIAIKKLPQKKWNDVKNCCVGHIGSLLELLQGKLSTDVMAVVTDRKTGLFPRPGEISLQCSCPDWAEMCKHVSAVLYGVGARLDESPELLFLLRGVDFEEMIGVEVDTAVVAGTKGSRKRIENNALADVFGIDMVEEEEATDGEKETTTQIPSAGTKKTSRASSDAGAATSKGVIRLRTKFGMSRSEFAKLLDVSAATIGNWEKKSGKLDLLDRTLSAFTAAKKLTKQQAWRKLKRER